MTLPTHEETNHMLIETMNQMEALLAQTVQMQRDHMAHLDQSTQMYVAFVTDVLGTLDTAIALRAINQPAAADRALIELRGVLRHFIDTAPPPEPEVH
jgi:hypothetical protein